MSGQMKYPDELRVRAVRLWRESDPKPTFRRLGEQLGVHPERLRSWVRQDEADRGERDDRPTTEMAEEMAGAVPAEPTPSPGRGRPATRRGQE